MINITAPINTLGYGIASYNIIKSLVASGENINYYPIGSPEPPEQAIDILNAIKVDVVKLKSPSVKIWHQNDVHHHVGKGMHVAFPIFELDRFSDQEVKSLAHNDRIFVCSKWAKTVIEGCGIRVPVHVVPLGVDTETFSPTPVSTRPKTVFFNCGKWEVRKGHDILVQCFNNAFDYNDDVELWMMCQNPFYSAEQQNQWERLYKDSKLGEKIRIIPRQNTHQDVYNIMKQADCGVFPARAEGWNLELLEMMACGKHVIATDYSAHTEFCNEQNSMLIDIKSREIAQDGVWFNGQGMWASLGDDCIEQTVSHMRTVHAMKKSGSLVQNTDGIYTSREFSWENSAKKFLDGLK